ncbi:putative secreted protein with PEP-CTERM sorting signal [Roseiarcus fermentans]|uniref:Putative secreted protein with PEP-CTERM sorting signal n=2 Tax=Roseiarcus fermentans TaxID=1473586 RepID=A0A366ES54_9HYPH|nr:putative secreted protein with PEP-CTERM sorting signal [Roseiarcus fermentans]
MFNRGVLEATALALVLSITGMTGARAGSVIYQALDATGSLYDNNQIGFSGDGAVNAGGAFGVGNSITFAGSYPGYVVSTVDLFGYAGGGSKPIEVDIYSGSDPNSGTLLGSQQVTPTGNGWTTEELDFHNLVVPQTVTYIVGIVGNSGSYDDSFVNWQQFTGAGGAPTVGTRGDMWYGSAGAFAVDNTFAVASGAVTNTLAVQVNAPEPATWAMMGLGFAALAVATARRARAPRPVAA